MLRDVSNVNMKTTIMGNEIDFPIGIAPTAMQKMAHPEGEAETARGIFVCISAVNSTCVPCIYVFYGYIRTPLTLYVE